MSGRRWQSRNSCTTCTAAQRICHRARRSPVRERMLEMRAFASTPTQRKSRLDLDFHISMEDGMPDRSTDSIYSIFNFFETITPPPTFPTFREGFIHVSNVVKMHSQFSSGVLLRNVEEYDRFPYLSYSVFHLYPTNTFIHDPSWVKVIREGHGENQVHHQGSFKELCTIWTDSADEGLEHQTRCPRSNKAAFIVVCCKVLGNAVSLETNWREWSGADYILNGLLPQQRSSLRRITFYKRAMSRCTFTHILLAEFHEAPEIYRLRDFVSLMNSRHCGLAALYTVDLQFNSEIQADAVGDQPTGT